MRKHVARLLLFALTVMSCIALSALTALAQTPPMAVSNMYATSEDGSLTVVAPGVLGNDSDPELQPITTELVENVWHGVLSLSPSGSFVYVPNPNWVGNDTFVYRVFDGELYSEPVTVTIGVTSVNDAPSFARGGNVIVDEDSGQYSGAWATSISPGPLESEPVSFTVTTTNTALFSVQPTISPAGQLSFTPASNKNGTVVATVRLRDAGGLQSTATSFTIAVQPLPDAPVAVVDSYSTTEGTSRVVAVPGVLTNDTDADGQSLLAEQLSAPAHGTLSFVVNGSFTYAPDPDWFGADAFRYRVFDGSDYSQPATVTLSVTNVNDAPSFAEGDDVTVAEDSGPFMIDWASAISAGPYETEAVSFSVACTNSVLFSTQPSVTPAGVLSFTPAADAFGSVVATVTLRDAAGAVSAPTTVAITVEAVNDAPALAPGLYGPSESAKLVSGSGLATDKAGFAVAVDGDTAVVGAPYADPKGADSGCAIVYVRLDGSWVQQATLTALDGAAQDVFGRAVAVDGDTIVVGASGDDDKGGESGSAYVFVRSGDTWSQQAKLLGSDSVDGDRFGSSVDISADSLVVGASYMSLGSDFRAGAAYAFTRADTTWGQETKLTAAVPADGDNFGTSVAIDGSVAVVGSPYAASGGSATVFTRSGSMWTRSKTLYASDRALDDMFGYSVALSGDTIIAGAYGDGTLSGSAYVYSRLDSGWAQSAKLRASDGSAADRFGIAVAISGDRAVIGANGDSDAGSYSGSGYVFVRSGSSWRQTTKLVDSLPAANDQFGLSVAFSSGGDVLFGSPGDSANHGSAFVFSPGIAVRFDEDTTLNQTTPTVLSRFSDAENDAMTLVIDSNAAHGALDLAPDGSFTYTPDTDWYGVDSFTVKAFDGQVHSTPMRVVLSVLGVNDAPMFEPGSEVQVAEDSGAYGASWATLISAGPLESDPVSFTVQCPATPLLSVTPKVSAAGVLTFTPASNRYGSVDATVTLVDANGRSSQPALLRITVNSVNDVPVAVADTRAATEDQTLTVSSSGVLSNDSDVEGPLTAVLERDVTHGTLILGANGLYTYVPAPDYFGTDSFIYRAFDGTDYSSPTTVTLAIAGVNDPPSFISGGDAEVNEDCDSVSMPWATSISPGPMESQPVSFTVVCADAALFTTQPKVDASGTLSFRPASDANGTAAATVTARDASGTASGPVSLAITVRAVNDAPVSKPDSGTVAEDGMLSAAVPGVLANDADVDSANLTAVLATDVSHGVLALSADGSYTYVPAPNYFGADSFTYRASDGDAFSQPATVSISVNSINDPPECIPLDITVAEDSGPYSGALASKLTPGPLEGEAVTVSMQTSDPSLFSTVPTANAGGQLSLTPAPDAAGVSMQTLTVRDAFGASTSATFTVTVTPVNDAPVTVPKPYLAASGMSETVAPQVLASDAFGSAVAASGDTMVVGSRGDDTRGSDAGAAYVYTRTADGWVSQGSLVATDAEAGDYFGSAVAIDGNTIVVGAYGEDGKGSMAGAAYVFARTGDRWVQQAKLTGYAAQAGDCLGYSVDIDGATVIAGAPFDDDKGVSSGSATVFIRELDVWRTQAKILGSDGAAGDQLGYAVAISGERAAVGANKDDDRGTDSGSAYLFARSWSGWNQEAKLTAQDGAAADYFGASVAMSPENVVIGAYGDDDAGSLSGSGHVFEKQGSSWVRTAKLLAASGAASDYLGCSSAIDGDRVVLGAFQGAWGPGGSASVFVKSGRTWSEQLVLDDSDRAPGDQFGQGVAIAGDTVVVGAPGDDGHAPAAGTVHTATLQRAISVQEDGSVSLPSLHGVLAYDFDADRDPLVASVHSDVHHGTLDLAADGSFVYQPDPNYFGTDSFSYRAFDGVDYSQPCTVSVLVHGINDAPSFSSGGDIVVPADVGRYSAQWATQVTAGPLEDEPVDFALQCSNEQLFAEQPAIDSGGVLTFAPNVEARDRETTLTVTLTDAYGATATATFAIDVLRAPDTTLTMTVSNRKPRYNSSVTLTATLTAAADGSAAASETILFQRLEGAAWVTLGSTVTSGSGVASLSVVPHLNSATAYRATFSGTSQRCFVDSEQSLVVPYASVGAPRAPSTMLRGRAATIYGYLMPRHAAGTYPIRIYKERLVSGRWRSYGYVKAKASNYSTGSKYSAAISLPYAGRWRFRAYAPADSGHAATWSSTYTNVSVR